MRDGESRMVPGAPRTVCSLVEKAPGDGKKIAVPRRRTHQTHLLSLLEKKKTEDINLIGLSRRGERTSPLIGCGRTKQTQDMFSLAGPHCAFSPVSHH